MCEKHHKSFQQQVVVFCFSREAFSLVIKQENVVIKEIDEYANTHTAWKIHQGWRVNAELL